LEVASVLAPNRYFAGVPLVNWRGIHAACLGKQDLKEIEIHDCGLPEIEAEENRSVEVLTITDKEGLSTVKYKDPWKTLSKFENLKFLDVFHSDYHSDMKDFFGHCSNMKQLEILKIHCRRNFTYLALQSINFPILREIHLTNVLVNHRDWITITETSPLIQKIALDCFFLDRGSLDVICEKLVQLKEIELGCGIYAPDIFPAFLKSSSLVELKMTAIMKLQMKCLGAVRTPFNVTLKTTQKHLSSWFRDNNKTLISTTMFLNNIRDFYDFLN
jgi:hypothetical protein